jgi:hypothetical protein
MPTAIVTTRRHARLPPRQRPCHSETTLAGMGATNARNRVLVDLGPLGAPELTATQIIATPRYTVGKRLIQPSGEKIVHEIHDGVGLGCQSRYANGTLRARCRSAGSNG